MEGSRLYEFHRHEVRDIKAARAYTLGVCYSLIRLQEGIKLDKPNLASSAIKEFLDHNYRLESCLDPVGHLLGPAAHPVMIPSWWAIHGLLGENQSAVQRIEVAHRAAWRLHASIYHFLWHVWGREHSGQLCSNDALAACEELVELHWQELRNALKVIVEYDCDGLKRAVELEATAAIERCRQSTLGDSNTSRESGVSKVQGGYFGGERLANALGIHPSRRNAFERQLERKRVQLGDSWQEVNDPRPNSPRYLYRADCPEVLRLAGPYKAPKPI